MLFFIEFLENNKKEAGHLLEGLDWPGAIEDIRAA